METKKTESKEKKGVIRKVIDNLAESTREAHKATKENIAAEKKAAKERHIDAITPRTYKERNAEIQERTSKYQPKGR